MTQPALALEGIRVVDCSRVLAGPFCAMLLSDLGADVIKVEDTGSGDESRTWPPHKDGESAAFLVLTTGIFSAFGIVSAIHHRTRTGLGQRVDASLLETAVGLLNYHAEGFLLTGALPQALGSSHPSVVPYRNFRCQDGQWVFVAAANDRLWQRLAPALGLAALTEDPRFKSNPERVKNRKDLEAALEAAIGRHDREALLAMLEKAGVPATPVNTVDQVMKDAQTAARSMIERAHHPRLGDIPVIGTPVKFSRMRAGVRSAAPLHGQHTDEVLAEHGYDRAAITALREKKVVR